MIEVLRDAGNQPVLRRDGTGIDGRAGSRRDSVSSVLGDLAGLDLVDGLAALDRAEVEQAGRVAVAAANSAAACSRTGATGMYSDMTDLLR
jgi:hypothetical protein